VVSDVVAQFNGRDLHDWKLRQFNIRRIAKTSEVLLVLDEGARRDKVVTYTSRELRFTGCRFVRTQLDLLGIDICGGDIATAYGQASSSLLDELAVWHPGFLGLVSKDESVVDCIHFRIEMIVPGGSLDIIARNFSWGESL
jgi:hypothetical protein